MRKMMRSRALLLALMWILICLPAARALGSLSFTDESGAEITFASVPLEPGAKGADVKALQTRLNALGFGAGEVDGAFGNQTEEAVRSFQAAAGLEETGIADAGTLTLLFSEEARAFTPEPMDDESEAMVWIPRTGKRYHRRQNCSGMKDPSLVTVSEAVRRGFTPCKKCY